LFQSTDQQSRIDSSAAALLQLWTINSYLVEKQLEIIFPSISSFILYEEIA